MLKLPENIINALSILGNGGFEGFVVGGCVRDLLMNREPCDWDITTNATPDETLSVFKDFRVVPTGLKHGTVTVLLGESAVEITTYRVDGDYSDNRRPDSVTYTRSLYEDLSRRDFTMNAIAYSPERGLVDIFNGRDDIENKIIRAVGDAEKRFREDALRILRALRFASTLGFGIEEETGAAVFKERELLRNISAERINNEFTKLLCGMNAGEVLRGYRSVPAVFMPEIAPMFDFDQRNRHHCYDVWLHSVVTLENVPQVPELRWAALLHDSGKPSSFTVDERGEGHFYGHAAAGYEIADRILERLRFDSRTHGRILQLIKHHDNTISTDEKRIKRWLGRYGRDFMLQLTALKRADNLAQSNNYRHRQGIIDEIEEIIGRIIERQECFSLRGLAVDGNDMLALGYSGSDVGNALRTLLDAVIDGKVQNEAEALLGYLKSVDL